MEGIEVEGWNRECMQIEFQFSSVRVLPQDLFGAGGSSSFVIPDGSLVVPNRKAVRRRKKKKGSRKLATVIDSLMDEIGLEL